MAPLPAALASLFARATSFPHGISNLEVSSLELDKRTADSSSSLDNILPSSLQSRDGSASAMPPMEAHDLGTRSVGVFKRESNYHPGGGSMPANKLSGPGYQVLFALIGTGMVLASIWFFFWAKNGGFHFQENDWDDYKSTVLRRKGPDGKTLSNATKSTKLGGGSVVHGQEYTRQKFIARSVVGRDEKGRKGILAKRGFGNSHSVTYSDDYMTESWGTQTVSDEMTEVRTDAGRTDAGGTHSKRYRDRDVHHYKREKPARVGGLNRVADGSHFDYTNSDRSDTYTETSEQPILHHQKEQQHKKREHKRTPQEEAERNAKIEAAKMERRWKREAEDAAAALARENARPPPPPAHVRKSSSPTKPAAQKQRRESRSRSQSPKKRDFSYQSGAASEVLSTAYTGTGSNTSSNRQSSYYDAYRPRNADGYGSDPGKRSSRQSSPRKGRGGGYRRGADSDLE